MNPFARSEVPVISASELPPEFSWGIEAAQDLGVSEDAAKEIIAAALSDFLGFSGSYDIWRDCFKTFLGDGDRILAHMEDGELMITGGDFQIELDLIRAWTTRYGEKQ